MKKVIFAFLLSILILPCSSFAASLSGTVFHDYNGNGLLDPGEPRIVGAEVSVGSQSFVSDENGLYWIGGLSNRNYDVSVKSPTDDPTTAFRYISVFKGWVDIPAYEMNGVQVPDQHLADAPVQSINESISIEINGDTETNISLMQGFLTLPFLRVQVPEPFIWNYFDVLNRQIICDDNPWGGDGIAMDFRGQLDTIGDPFNRIEGVIDGHTGLDYIVEIGKYIIHSAPKSSVFALPIHDDGQIMIHTMFPDSESNEGIVYKNTYAHVKVQLVGYQEVYRGQIIALAGDSGAANKWQDGRQVPNLHFDLSKTTIDRCTHYLDPYRTTIPGQYLENYSGSDVSYWTKDNDPQHPF